MIPVYPNSLPPPPLLFLSFSLACFVEQDSSIYRGDPFEYMLGNGLSMIGWEEGLLDMCIGAQRRLTVPANKAVYASTMRPMWGVDAQGTATLPADATLVFDIELLNIKKAAASKDPYKDPRTFDPFTVGRPTGWGAPETAGTGTAGPGQVNWNMPV